MTKCFNKKGLNDLNKNIDLLKQRVNFSYYNENMSENEISKLLNISRQRVSAILNSNKDHRTKKRKKFENVKIKRKVQFYNRTSPRISIPKELMELIGINNNECYVEIMNKGKQIIIRKFKEEDN